MSVLANIDVSRETLERLQEFEALVAKWTKSINLIAPSTVSNLWDRHIVDSAQLYQFAQSSAKNWVDLGSGGGFPGIVLAVLARERDRDQQFTLIESDQRKSTFLRTAIRSLDLNATVEAIRIESAAPQNADVITARALSPLNELLEQIYRHISPDGTAIVPKGRNAQQEIEQTAQNWSFDLRQAPSITNADAQILTIRGLKRE